jgi:hypothetical protein
VITTEELFATEMGWGRLHDVMSELAGPPYPEFTKEEVRAVWDRLPSTIRDIAHCWGMETVFGDEAYEWLQENPSP